MLKRKIALIKVSSQKFEGYSSKKESIENAVYQIQSYPPLGLCYLAAYLNSKGITDVEIIDCIERRYTSGICAEYIVKNNFDVVGISVDSFFLKEVNTLIGEIRKRKKEIIIVLGGIHIAHYPNAVKVLNADYGIRGDGEESLFKLLTNFNHDIDGLVYLENGEVKYNQTAKIDNLDILPFPVTLGHKYKFPFYRGGAYSMIMSRGCPYNCIFCGIPHRGEYRKRAVENVYKEMEFLKQKGYDYIDFKDDCFTVDRDKVIKLCNLIINGNLKIKWGTSARADLVDYDLLKLMKQAGCHNLRFGVESGVIRIRNEIMGKSLSNEAIFNLVRWCRKLRIKTIGYIIFGTPTETIADMKQTIKFIKKVNPDYMDALLAMPIPGSRLHKIALEEKKINEDVWTKIAERDCQIPIYTPEGITLEDMKMLKSKAYKSFYLNPVKIIKEVVDTGDIGDILAKFKIARNIFFAKLFRY